MAATEHLLLFAAALSTCVVSGSNEGATLAATSSRSGALAPLESIALLSIFAGVTPLLVGTKVATTIAHGLVSFEAHGGQLAFLLAAGVALGVVAVLAHRGLPTSLTMALTGAIVGVGVGDRLPTRLATALGVLVAGIAAPFVSLAIAYLLAPLARLVLGTGLRAERRGRPLGVLSFLAESVAYGANGAEKLVAILAVADGTRGGAVRATPLNAVLIAVCFALGALSSIRVMAPRLGPGLARAGPDNTLAAVVGATVSVFGGAVVGIPLSSTQAVTAALLGGSARLVPWSVRWQAVREIAMAWVLTLPLALGAGALGGLALHLAT